MLCEKCGQKEATIHLTSVADGQVTKLDLCEDCVSDAAQSLYRMPQFAAYLPLHKQSVKIVERDPRYRIEAYEFVREAVNEALLMKDPVRETFTRANIPAKELLDVLRVFALLRFGKEAKQRLNGWGVKSCEDFGEIVFNLVDVGLLGKRPSDRKEDFQDGYNFDDAFPEN
jgi:uncharacterized repeat protein (TIGR04138 family)